MYFSVIVIRNQTGKIYFEKKSMASVTNAMTKTLNASNVKFSFVMTTGWLTVSTGSRVISRNSR